MGAHHPEDQMQIIILAQPICMAQQQREHVAATCLFTRRAECVVWDMKGCEAVGGPACSTPSRLARLGAVTPPDCRQWVSERHLQGTQAVEVQMQVRYDQPPGHEALLLDDHRKAESGTGKQCAFLTKCVWIP